MAKKKPKVEEIRVDDPAFGRLIYDGFHHRGWGGSFADARFAGWGRAVAEAFPDREEADEKEEDSADDFLSDMLSIIGTKFGEQLTADPEAAKILEAGRAFVDRVEAYDGSLDADKLRRAGRFKISVRNDGGTPPTPAQQAAWRAFLDGGDAPADRVATALLQTYQAQRPERLRWWASLYGDSPDRTLPAVQTRQQMRDLLQISEFRVYPEKDAVVAVGIVFTVVWADREIEVLLADGKTVSKIRPTDNDHGIRSEPDGPVLDSPAFGRLQWFGLDDVWVGTFHCPKLRGYCDASETRHKFKTGSGYVHPIYRPLPAWDVITAVFGLAVAGENGAPPTPGQEAVWRSFTADTDKNVDAVLKAIFDWYQQIRPSAVAQMNGDDAEKNATLPPVTSPQDLADFIEFSGVRVLNGTWKNDTPCVILSFAWFDEHGLAVRWRDGRVETVGDFDSVEDD